MRRKYRLGPLLAIVVMATSGCGDDSSGDGPLTAESYSVVPIWSDRYDSGDENTSGLDSPERLIAANGIVVASGYGGPDLAAAAYIVRALDGADGSLLWEDRFEASGCGSGAGDLVVIDDRLLVGAVRCQREGIRAYDLRTGALLWEAMEEAASADLSAPTLVAVGARVASVDGSVTGTRIRVYDPVDGGVMWDRFISGALYHRACGDDHALVVTGFQNDGTESYRYRAYDPASGEQLWEVARARGGAISNVFQIAVGGGMFLSWSEVLDVPGNTWLNAHDASTGEVLWSNRLSYPTGVWDIVVGPDRVYVAGEVAWYEEYPDYPSDGFFAASYSAESGKQIWWDRQRAMGRQEHARKAVLDGDRLFVAGLESQLRAYNAITGEILEEILPGDLRAIGRDIATDGRNFYSLAAALEPDATTYEQKDFLIRAYREVLR